jgi:hypothetical protein
VLGLSQPAATRTPAPDGAPPPRPPVDVRARAAD